MLRAASGQSQENQLLPNVTNHAAQHVVFRTFTTEANQNGSNDFFPFFIAGMSVAAFVEGRVREAIIGLSVAVLIDLYHLRFHYLQPSAPIVLSRSVVLWIGTAAMYFAANYQPSWRVKKLLLPLSFVGLISYPLYLIHQDAGKMILRWLEVDLVASGGALFIRAFAIPLLMMLIAWLIHHFVEQNSIKPLTRFLTLDSDNRHPIQTCIGESAREAG